MKKRSRPRRRLGLAVEAQAGHATADRAAWAVHASLSIISTEVSAWNHLFVSPLGPDDPDDGRAVSLRYNFEPMRGVLPDYLHRAGHKQQPARCRGGVSGAETRSEEHRSD
jgi:hypothetical protein